jgi:hypothetical protein
MALCGVTDPLDAVPLVTCPPDEICANSFVRANTKKPYPCFEPKISEPRFHYTEDGNSGYVNIPNPWPKIVLLAIPSRMVISVHDLCDGLVNPDLLLL